MHFSYEALHPELGVAVAGIDLRKELSDSEMDELLDMFATHSVVAIHCQQIEPEHQLRFLKRFGTPKISQRKEFHLPDHPEIGKVGNVKNPDGSPAAFLDRHGNLWHSDTAGDMHVDAVTMFHYVKTPSVGGDTLFCSMHAAYERLPDTLRSRIEGRKVVHNFNKHNDYLLAKNAGSSQPLSAEDPASQSDAGQEHRRARRSGKPGAGRSTDRPRHRRAACAALQMGGGRSRILGQPGIDALRLAGRGCENSSASIRRSQTLR